MHNGKHPGPTALVIFGAGGDLTWRKLIPAVFHLHADGWLPEEFAVIGVDRKGMDPSEFRDHLHDGVDDTTDGDLDPQAWEEFAGHLDYLVGEFDDKKTYAALADKLKALDDKWDARASRVYYLATPPALIEVIPPRLDAARLCHDRERERIVVEKPFGHDLASAKELNGHLTRVFEEKQVFRIDHYLGKETVQNILAFRFGNALFEPIWDRRYIDHVQITVAERVGVENRGGYYEGAGALRDMVQNHLLQMLCLIAMEPPVSFEADEIRNKKVDVLRAIRPIAPEDVAEVAVRGQYAGGWLQGDKVQGYRDEPQVAPDSGTETFAALKLFVDNWRWQDVPFYLRTGKHLPSRVSEVCIHFRPVPHKSFPASATAGFEPNRLLLRIQPDEGILLRFQAKRPGQQLRLSPVEMKFIYADAFRDKPPEAYETLLLDVMQGDATLFMRADQVETAWSVIQPILDAWADAPASDFPNYPAGTWGPEGAETLIARDGRSWVTPSLPEDDA